LSGPTWVRRSSTDELPADPVGEALARTVSEIVVASTVELHYCPTGGSPGGTRFPPCDAAAPTAASATGPGPPGWEVRLSVTLPERIASLVSSGGPLADIVAALPTAALRAGADLRGALTGDAPRLRAELRRALRDAVASELLVDLTRARADMTIGAPLVDETIEFLVELSGARVEAQDLTHGVVITDAVSDEPRLKLRYPADIRTAKRGPLLFDGRRSILLVDRHGRARTELQRHRFDRIIPGAPPRPSITQAFVESGWLVGEATRYLGGIGFFLREDRTILAFIGGQPMLVRRGEHWSAFPLELGASIARMIGGGSAAQLVAQAAFQVSAQRHGAILAVVNDAAALDGSVPIKDRYDLRDDVDRSAMRVETRLHHLIDASDLDANTLARLASLDGATIVDRDARLIAYGAIVGSADSEHEGARTAAARTLSEVAEVVLKVSVDGDITVFRRGAAITSLLGLPDRRLS
jgi:DNA integrity scanning protein DisA with diadenylate cyclase activity